MHGIAIWLILLCKVSALSDFLIWFITSIFALLIGIFMHQALYTALLCEGWTKHQAVGKKIMGNAILHKSN